MKARRSGYTLLEMVIVMVAAAAVTGVAVGALALGYRIHHASRGHLYAATVVDRLADRFRQDCHAAVGFRALDSGAGWQLVLPDAETIDYRPAPGGLDRIEQSDGRVRHRDTFALRPGLDVNFTLEEDEQPAVVRLELEPSGDAVRPVPARPVRIVAVLGLDHRFETWEGPE